ncbi:TetR/AcrR family transcriptional regulator [Afipia sp. TerB]
MAKSESRSGKAIKGMGAARAEERNARVKIAEATHDRDRRSGGDLGKAPRRGGKPSSRELRASERRAAIVTAGLDEFTARGFAATRLDDVAKRAGVAKGTIYLHFKDKEALFQELVRTALVPLIGRMANPPLVEGISARALMEMFAETFSREVVGTRRGDILRMIIAEGARFPSLAEFYHREVVSVGIAGMRRIIEHGIARGEITNRAIADFPQLVVAPAVVAVIWQGLFGQYAPLDAAAMLRVHLDLIFGKGQTA